MDTESQLLTALNEQRDLLRQLVWLGIVIAVAAVARVGLGIFNARRQLRQEGFSALATPLYIEGRYEELLELCRERVALRPNDASPHWFMGLAHFEKGQLQEAAPHFERSQELAPTWGPQVRAYLRKIRESSVV